MPRPAPLSLAALSLLAAAAAAAAPPAYLPKLARPEVTKLESAGQGGDEAIILIMICPSRPDRFSVYGFDKPTTEHLAKIADDGIAFSRVYANAPWTRAGSASVFTGLNASRHNVQRDVDKLSPKLPTLAQRLKRAGYRTGGFVANGNASSLGHLHRGFDLYRDSQSHWHKLASDTEVVDEALAWIDTVKGQKFFATLFFVDPHDPYQAPAEYEKKWLPEGFKGEPRRRASWEYKNDYPEAERQQLLALYDAGLDYADDQIGRLVAALKERGLYDKATIVMTGDHGEGFGEHGYYLHAHHLEEEIVRLPLIVKRPGLKPTGGYSDVLTNQADVVPTILEVAGVKQAKELKGLPLLSTMAGAGVPAERVVFSEYNEFGIRRAAIVRRDAKLILERPAYEKYLRVRLNNRLDLLPTVSFDKEVMTFYRLDQDPFEKTNAWTPGDPVAEPLLTQLRAFIADGAEQEDGVEKWCKKRRKSCKKTLDAWEQEKQAAAGKPEG